MAKAIALDTLKSNLEDIENDIQDAANRNLVDYSRFLTNELSINLSTDELKKITKEFDCAKIEIIDTGDGIPEEELATIWDRYYRWVKNGYQSKES